MRVKILTSRRHDRRVGAALSWLRERPALEEIQLVADRRRAADELVRDLALTLPGGGRLGVRSTTLRQLAAQVALRESGLAPLSRLAAEAVVARALDQSFVAFGEFEFFEPVREFPGFQPALVATLSDLRLAEVEPSELEALGARGRDLSRLLRAYVRELESFGLGDEAALFESAIVGVSDGAADRAADRTSAALGGAILWLDPQVTSRLEARWLGALAATASEGVVLLPTADAETIDRLEAQLGVAAISLDESDEEQVPYRRLDRSRSYLFERDVPPPESRADRETSGETDDSLVFFSAPGEGQEAVEIARRLHALARDGVAFDRVAILLRNPTVYQPLVEAALDRAQIPAYYSRGVLRPDASGRALLALIDCAAEGLSAQRFAEYLAFAQVPIPTDSGAPPTPPIPWLAVESEGGDELAEEPAGPPIQLSFDFDAPAVVPVVAGSLATPSQWEQLLVEAAVVEGEERWRRRLAGLEAELRKQLRKPGEDEEARSRVERSLMRLQHLERFALPLIGDLAAWPTAATWEEWTHRLEQLVVRALRRPERVLQVLAELRPMAEVAQVTRGEVRRVLADRLTNMRGGSEGKRYGKVLVAPIEEARGRSFHTVFLPGLAEGVFPRQHFEDPLLLDRDRNLLIEKALIEPALIENALIEGEGTESKAGGNDLATRRGLATREVRSSRERLLAALAVGCAEERLVASYPTLDAIQERARVPSFYALDLLRAADGALPDQRSLERWAADSSALRQGWPAPRDPDAAIDASEFDLAFVEPLLRGLKAGRELEQLRGGANYLLAVSDRLSRSLRQRGRRWRNFFGAADGMVGDRASSGGLKRPDLAALLEPRRLSAQAYSPTALQSWAACPYRFFLKGVLRLRPRDEAVRLERLDPRTRGSLYHEIQAETLRRLAEGDQLPVRSANLELALGVLDERFDAVAEASEEELAPALSGVWRSEMESLRVDLRGWLRHVAAEEEPWTPIHYELGFGLPLSEDRDPGSVESSVEVLGRFQIRGAIDLVELNTGSGRLRVTDHKTGRPPQAKEVSVGEGEVLQPLLYALAAQEVLGRQAERGRLYFSTRRGSFETREVPVSPTHLHYLGEVLESVDAAIGQVFLPAAPRQGACDYCDFRPVCGPYEESRIARKRRDRLETLDRVRTFQ